MHIPPKAAKKKEKIIYVLFCNIYRPQHTFAISPEENERMCLLMPHVLIQKEIGEKTTGMYRAYGLVDRVLESRSKGLVFNSYWLPCIEKLSGKLLFPCCPCPPNSIGYLVEK